jgi:hypothetical protein
MSAASYSHTWIQARRNVIFATMREPPVSSSGFLALKSVDEGLVDQTGASWNHVAIWLRRIDGLRRAA